MSNLHLNFPANLSIFLLSTNMIKATLTVEQRGEIKENL